MREIQAPNVIYELFKKSFDKCERKWTTTNFWRKAKGPYTFPKTISFLLNYWWDVQIQLFNLSWRNLAILLTHKHHRPELGKSRLCDGLYSQCCQLLIGKYCSQDFMLLQNKIKFWMKFFTCFAEKVLV